MATTVEFLEEVAETRYLLKCSKCSGDGYYKGTCGVCGGRGKVLVEIDGHLPFVECAKCNGDGYYKGTCNACGGVGAQPASGRMNILT